MTAFRAPGATYRFWLLALVACALLVRALVPTGWMPVADVQGVRIVPCSGSAPVATPGRAHHAMAGMTHPQRSDHHAPGGDHPGTDHPCAFAGLAAALDLPAVPPPLPVVLLRSAPSLARSLVAIGHGLAAPPPPQTGPPLT